MASLIWAFDGSDATQDLSFASATTGTVASATDQKHTGPRALKLSTGAGPTPATATFDSVLADAGRRVTVWFRINSLAGAGGTPALLRFIETSGANVVFSAGYDSASGKINLVNVGVATILGSTVLTAGVWHRMSVSYVISSTTVFRIKVWLDGNLEIDMQNTGTMTRSGTSRFTMVAGSQLGANVDVWYDDLYIDDGTTIDDPGDFAVTSKRAFANGTANNFTTQIGSGGSGYGSGHAPQVNEQPLSQTNGWAMIGAGGAVTEEYTIEGASAGDVDISSYTLAGYLAWVFAKSLASETGQIIAGGATSTINLTSTATLFTKAATSAAYPSGGTAVGIVTDTSLTTVSLYEAGVLVVVSADVLMGQAVL